MASSHTPSTAPTSVSPTFTNPDLILPPQNTVRMTPSPPPTTNPTTVVRMSSFNAGKRRSAMGPRLPIAGAARPTMPGSWQTESDFNDPNSLVRRSSLSAAQASSSNKRLSRTASLRTAPTPWQRTSSKDRGENGYSSSSLLGAGTRRLTLAERLEEEDPPDSPYTTTSEDTVEDESDDIGSKAEEILANAKKRLTAMEGNLNRARSLSATRGASPASSTGEVPSRYSKRVSRSQLSQGNSWALTSSKLRQASLTAGGTAHLRVASETVASTQPASTSSPQRSYSALGHGGAASPALRSDWTDESSTSSYSNGLPRHLEPLQEDELYGDEMASQPSQASPLLRQASNAALFYSTPTSSTSTLSRARSSIALRDLQEGVGDLKDKVQQLKERTKRDSMKRASLQRLKTPSPFTHSEHWVDPRDRESKLSTMSTETAVRITESTPPQHQAEFNGQKPDINEPLSAESASSIYSTQSADFKSPLSKFAMQHSTDFGDSPLLPVHPKIRHIPPTPTTPARRHTPNQSTSSNQTSDTNDDEPISPSLSDAFPAPPETTPTPPRSRAGSVGRRSRSSSNVSHSGLPPVSHEDNPDAFDYSRFLLDSAMGNYALANGSKGRSRSPSASSTGTEKTTRPRKNSSARMSKVSNTSSTSRASTAKRGSLSPAPPRSRSRASSTASNSGATLAQRRASSRSNSSASLHSILIPDGRRSVSPKRRSGVSDATSPPTTLSPPNFHSKGDPRPGHTRQLSTDSISAVSVASFATALERASSQLTIRSMSRSTLRNASGGSGGPVPTHRAGLEAYNSSRNNSFVSAVSSHSPPDIMRAVNNAAAAAVSSNSKGDTFLDDASPVETSPSARLRSSTITAASIEQSKRDTQNQLNALLIDEADALRTPTSPAFATLPRNISKASAAILSAVLAVSHAAVREDDERRGIQPSVSAPRMMDPKDEAVIGRVLDGILGAAVGLIGRSARTGGDPTAPEDHGTKGNSWRASSVPGATEESATEVDEKASEQLKDIWRMRCEVARRALVEEKPGEGF